VAWWARRELREAEEECCDAWVVWALPAAAPAYAAALVETAAFLSRARAALPLAASGIGPAQSLKRRVTMILRDTPPRSLSVPGLLAVLAAAALLLPLLPSWAQPAAAEETEGPPAQKKSAAEASKKAVGHGLGVAVADFDADGWPDVFLFVAEDAKAKPKPPAAADRAALIEEAKYDVELARAQLDVKRAQLRAAEEALVLARRRLERMEKLAANRAVSQEELDQIKGDVAVQEAQIRVKQAELIEPEIRLRQAQRRLEALQSQGAAPPAAAATAGQVLHFREYGYDFGPVVRGTVVGHVIPFVNKSGAPVEIGAVRTSSAAVKASVKEATLKPGGRALLAIRLDTARFVGRRAFDIYVAWTGPQPGEAHLRVSADSQEKARGTADSDSSESTGSSESKRAADAKRIEELEKKLESLRKEIDGLRKKLPQRGPAPERPGSSGDVVRPNPPGANVRGKVQRVDPNGLVQITIGRDSGLALGHTLEVYRLRPQPKYLGMIRIVTTEPDRAVGQLVTRATGSQLEIQPGDEVASSVAPR
jgi:hypothetical protein